MDWYITKELIGPFLFGVGLFTSVAVTVGALFELVPQSHRIRPPLQRRHRNFSPPNSLLRSIGFPHVNAASNLNGLQPNVQRQRTHRPPQLRS